MQFQDKGGHQGAAHKKIRLKEQLKQNVLLKKNFVSNKIKFVLKMKRSTALDQNVAEDDGKHLEPEGDQVPQGNPVQGDLLVNMDQ